MIKLTPGICHVSSAHASDDVRITLKMAGSSASQFETIVVIRDGNLRNLGFEYRCFTPSRGRMRRATIDAFRATYLAFKTRMKIVHLHDPELIPFGFLLRLAGRKVVIDSHEDLPKDILDKFYIKSWLRKPLALMAFILNRFAYIYSSAVIGATPAITETFPSRKSLTVMNLPIIGELKSTNATVLADRSNVFAYVGGITRIRMILEILDALEIAYKECELKLKLAGPFESPELQRECQAHPAWDRVEYLGQVSREEMRDVLSQSIGGLVIFAPVANHVEAIPNKLFEYMSAGIPVVSSDFDSWRKFVEEPGTGLMVDPQDAQKIANALLQLCGNRKLAQEMGSNGAKFAEKHSWQNESRKLTDLYRKLLEGRK